MNILLFSTYYLPYISGVVTCPMYLFQKLKENNNIKVLCFRHDSSLKVREVIDETEIIRMPFLLRISKGFISPQSIKYFISEARKSDRIILSIPNFEGLALAIVGKIMGKKVISIYHCDVYFQKNYILKVISLVLSFSIFIQLIFSDKIIFYTKDYQKYSRFGRLFLFKSVAIYPPVPEKENYCLNDDKYVKLNKDSINIGFIGRISREKGIEYLIDGLNLLSKYKNSKNITLFIAGPSGNAVVGENEYYNKIMNKLKDTKGFKYKILGKLSNDELTSFYNGIDILALTSINKTEAFGLVQLEAIRQGKPVLASNLPGVRELVSITKMGEISEIESSESIANKLEKIINNYDTYVTKEKLEAAKILVSYDKAINNYKKVILD